MLTFLQSIAETVAQFGALVLWGAIEAVNTVLAGVATVFNGAAEALPGFPAEPAPPSMIEGINWFFAVGTVISVGSSLVVSYGAFLSVRWIFKKVGTL